MIQMELVINVAVFLGATLASAWEDLSYNKVATQYPPYSSGSQYGSYDARDAVDRNVATCARAAPIGCNDAQYHHMTWTVDLGGIYRIGSINILFKDDNGYAFRQRGRFAGFSLYVSNTTSIQEATLCYKDELELPPLNFTTSCTKTGRYVIYSNNRDPGVTYPKGFETENVYTELCEVKVTGCKQLSVYGPGCNSSCPVNCRDSLCNIHDGKCFACKVGWTGEMCQKECPSGTFGMDCARNCTPHCKQGITINNSSICDHINGSCLNGCEDGYTGAYCTYDPCANVDCNKGSCKALSGNLTKCLCDVDWFGEFCNVDPCEHVNCNQGNCEALALNNTRCNCDENWYGRLCNINPCAGKKCVGGVCEILSETETRCICQRGWVGESCEVEPVTYRCDFEEINEPQCFLQEDLEDDYNFTRIKGPTPTWGTGPISAYNGSFYKYAETSNHKPGDVATLQSNIAFPVGTYCLSLALHMEGLHVGTLRLSAKQGTSDLNKKEFVWKQSKKWFLYKTEMRLTPKTKIIIEAIRGGKTRKQHRGDIALDNIQLSSLPCA